MDQLVAFIVEDDADLSAIFAQAAQSAGYAVETFQTGDAAIARLAEATPFVMVLDLHLPGVTGPQILNYVRGEARLKDIYVLVTSADDRLAEYVRDKADMVLHKPVSFVQLRELIQRLRSAGPR
jgi:DNA-binding response OmpR family regulator